MNLSIGIPHWLDTKKKKIIRKQLDLNTYCQGY